MNPIALSYRLPGFIVLAIALAVHVVWGVTLVLSGGHLLTTPTAPMLAALSQDGAGLVYLLVAGLASLGLTRAGRIGAAMMVPQLAVLYVAAFSAFSQIILGAYPDGTVPSDPHLFILVDQALVIAFAFGHGLAVIAYHGQAQAIWKARASLSS